MPAAAQDLTPITFVQPSPSAINSFPVFVAIGEGYFADEGLEVTVESINGSGPVLQALSAGQAQFGRPGPARCSPRAPAASTSSSSTTSPPAPTSASSVQQDATYQTPADLKGRSSAPAPRTAPRSASRATCCSAPA